MNDEEFLSSVSFDELENIDLDELEDLTDDELLIHFKNLAVLASEGQLRNALGITLDEDVYEYDTLVKIYAERKHQTALKLRRIEE